MPLPPYQEAYSGQVNEVTLGGGTRKKTVTIGGAKTVAYGGDRAATGRRPVIAVDVLDARARGMAARPGQGLGRRPLGPGGVGTQGRRGNRGGHGVPEVRRHSSRQG